MAIPRPPALPSGPLAHNLGPVQPPSSPKSGKELDRRARNGSIQSKISSDCHGMQQYLTLFFRPMKVFPKSSSIITLLQLILERLVEVTRLIITSIVLQYSKTGLCTYRQRFVGLAVIYSPMMPKNQTIKLTSILTIKLSFHFIFNNC